MHNPPELGQLDAGLDGRSLEKQGKGEPHLVVRSVETFDPAEFELELHPWELMCRPRTGGEFKHAITGVTTAGFTLYREKFNAPVDVLGLSPADTIVIGAPLCVGREAQYWGARYSGNTMPSSLPGPLDVKLDAGHHHQVAILDIPFLRDSLPEELFDGLMHAIRSRMLSATPDVLQGYLAWGRRLFKVAREAPSLLGNPSILFTLRQELLEHLSRIAAQTRPARDFIDLSDRRQGLRKVLDHFRSDFEKRTSMADLCRVSGISERSLQYAFQEELGMTPYQFLKRRRFHAARRALTVSTPQDSSVSQVAMRHGFYELGRFSVDYRRLFGESPSQTIARSRV